MAQVEKVEFRNNTQGFLGYISLDRNGHEKPLVVEPGGTVFLSEEEQQLTANSHRNAEDNPFIPHQIQHRDLKTGDVTREFEAPLLEKVNQARATGAAQRPIGAPVQGDSDDEVGTPNAPTKPKPRRKSTPRTQTRRKTSTK